MEDLPHVHTSKRTRAWQWKVLQCSYFSPLGAGGTIGCGMLLSSTVMARGKYTKKKEKRMHRTFFAWRCGGTMGSTKEFFLYWPSLKPVPDFVCRLNLEWLGFRPLIIAFRKKKMVIFVLMNLYYRHQSFDSLVITLGYQFPCSLWRDEAMEKNTSTVIRWWPGECPPPLSPPLFVIRLV